MVFPPDFKELLTELAKDGVNFVVVGGYAVAFHGRPRTTKDIDIVFEASPENLKRAAKALDRFGAPASVVRDIAALQDSEVVFMGQAPLRIDFMRSIDGVASDALFREKVVGKFGELHVPFVCLDHLIENKRAAARPQDLIDAEFLEKIRAKAK